MNPFETIGFLNQKPGAKILQTTAPAGVDCDDIAAYINHRVQMGLYTDHATYGRGGQAIVDQDRRHSYQIPPDDRADMFLLMMQVVRQYWRTNFNNTDTHILAPTQVEMMYYPPGVGIGLHCDDHVESNGQAIGQDHHRTITSILYLNDEFEGGEIEFPEQDTIIKPTKGLFVIFPGNINFKHRVRPITSGHRMSYQMQYGMTPAHIPFPTQFR